MDQKASSIKFTALIPWSIATFYAFFQFLGQTATGVMGSNWMQDFHLNKIGLSNLSGAFFYTYVLMQIPAGILFDRYPVRYILALAALIMTCGCFLLAHTESYHIALLARLLMGLGSAFSFVGLFRICATHFPSNRFSLMLGISEGLTMLGVTIGIVFLNWLVIHLSWRSAIWGGGIITSIVMILTFLLVQDPVPETLVAHQHKEFISLKIIMQRLKIIFSNQQFILGSLYGFFMFSIVNAFASLWGISFLIHADLLSPQTAANMVAIIFIGFAFGGPLSGGLTKILDQKRTILLIGGGCAAVTMSIIIFCPHIPEFILYSLFFLIGLFCSVYIICFGIIKDTVSPTICATALASTNMVIMLGAPLLQVLIGGLLQHHFFGLTNNISIIYRLSLGILPIGMLIAFISAFWIRQ